MGRSPSLSTSFPLRPKPRRHVGIHETRRGRRFPHAASPARGRELDGVETMLLPRDSPLRRTQCTPPPGPVTMRRECRNRWSRMQKGPDIDLQPACLQGGLDANVFGSTCHTRPICTPAERAHLPLSPCGIPRDSASGPWRESRAEAMISCDDLFRRVQLMRPDLVT